MGTQTPTSDVKTTLQMWLTVRPFGLDEKPAYPNVVEEISNCLMTKILKTHFANVAVA